jgi:hypothetical protein
LEYLSSSMTIMEKLPRLDALFIAKGTMSYLSDRDLAKSLFRQ